VKIGELAAASGTTTKTIRFYEQAGVLPEPSRTATGYRDYGPETVDRLQFIRRAQAAGLTLREVRQIVAIRDSGQAPCGHVRSVLGEHLDQVRAQIAELVTLEAHLETLMSHAQRGQLTEHDQANVCWILETDPADTPSPTRTEPATHPHHQLAPG
jgi:DNA-binding transcriptional MerR regulator